MKRVFISYSREQEKFTEQLRDQLQSWGHFVWRDLDSIAKGAYWPDEIDKGLKGSDLIVGVLTPDAVASRMVKNEWDWALKYKKRLILLMYQECQVPMNYVSINYINFENNVEAGFSKLKAALKAVDYPRYEAPISSITMTDEDKSSRSRLLMQIQHDWIEGVLMNAVSTGEMELAFANQSQAS